MTRDEMERRATVLAPSPDFETWRALEQLRFEEEGYWQADMRRLAEARALVAMDGPFYVDTREPFISGDQAQVTLATTMKALYAQSAFPVLGGQYFARLGKRLRIRAFGKISTILTPANGQFSIFYGTGADANGTVLASSAAFALTASQTNLSWEVDFEVHCRSTGSAGTLFATGKVFFNNAVVANTLQPILIPASAAVVSGAVDLTAANIISLQFSRSGSTAEVMTTQDLTVEAMN